MIRVMVGCVIPCRPGQMTHFSGGHFMKYWGGRVPGAS